ncbi:hypothetical protein [Streptomyces sp. OR43]|uniref:hypothetical protein n=1 Tax=Streptomyces sp. or43 TaxID=2478957 RepID=UPI0011CDC609|nr:hypothetical protein [Streptomyces sp. or43]TXS34506.1 hypothetical protein EAO72_41230 [Streptomyces sp. or43]
MPDTTPTTELREQLGQVLRRWGLLDEVNDPAAAEEFAVTDLMAVLRQPPARLVLGTTDQQPTTEAHRLSLSEALGLGTGAPWGVIRDRAAELSDQAAVLSAELTRRAPLMGEYAAEIHRLRAERTELVRQLDCLRGDMRDMEAHVREQDAEFEHLRRMADEAQQPGAEVGPTVADVQAMQTRMRADAATHDVTTLLGLIAAWHRSSEGGDVLIDDLEQAGFRLPEPAAGQPDTETEAAK